VAAPSPQATKEARGQRIARTNAVAVRQVQLWSTPHGVVKAALAGQGSMQGRTIAFAVPGRFRATATVDTSNLIESVDATLTNPVLGDMAVTVSYAEYRDFDGVKFPTRIRQTYGGFPVSKRLAYQARRRG
jgi:hypothetical protein